MSSIHVASAANEIAQALPSTATVTVSKHGIQAVETLELDAQTASDSLINFTRTFSGLEVLTNPYLRYRLKTTANFPSGTSYVKSPETLREWKKHLRPTSNPIANAAGSINLTINNASLSINPKDHHRLISTAYPDEPDVSNQRAHYGLNQLDQYADPYDRTFQIDSGHDDIEKQHNANALRETYPSKAYCQIHYSSSNGALTRYQQIKETDFEIAIFANVPQSHTTTPLLDVYDVNGNEIGKVRIASNADGTKGIQIVPLLFSATTDPTAITAADLQHIIASKENIAQISGFISTPGIPIHAVPIHMPSMKLDANVLKRNSDDAEEAPVLQNWIFTHDIYQPLAHPYFRDNKMRDNTLVNVRYFDCDINITSINACLEAGLLGELENNSNAAVTYTTELMKADDTALNAASPVYTGVTPQLIFDLVTPSVPLPTISDKVIQTFHAIQSEGVSADSQIIKVNSGNIQLSQVPDKIYVFIRSSKDATVTRPAWVPTRLATVTGLRVRTPQNSAFLINMDQESLYQMSCRNGSKQSRSSFMSSLGSVVCIDPEKDLGGYTNGVLVPFTFEVVVDAVEPLSDLGPSAGGSIVGGSDLKRELGRVHPTTAYGNGETWTMYVVCELQGHLYLMADGTGKQTKSNLTVTEVADAVADGLHHPSTFPGGRVGKMDAGLLGEIGKASGVDDSAVRDALRA